jgi:hypothetical protein
MVDIVVYATAPHPAVSETLTHVVEGRALVCEAPIRHSDGVEYKLLANEPEVKALVDNLKRAGFLLLGARP